MKQLKHYVLMSEFCKKYKIANYNISRNKKIEKYYPNNTRLCFLSKKSLTKEYGISNFDECTNLENCYPSTRFFAELNANANLHNNLKSHKDKMVYNFTIDNVHFIKLPIEFMDLTKQGFQPFYISNKQPKEYAQQILTINNMLIGFYRDI